MRTITITSAMLCTTLAIPAARTGSQFAPLKTLGAPHAKFAGPFTHVSAVREQSDGRVVVLDDYDRRIFHLDFRARTAIPLGRSGQGPGEYTLPLRLVALAGDTTLAVDMSGGGGVAGRCTSTSRRPESRRALPIALPSDLLALRPSVPE